MPRNRLRLSIYVGAALLAVGGGAVAAVAATTHHQGRGGLTATFTKDSDWGTGYQAHYTIKNTGGAAVTGWQLVFAPAGEREARQLLGRHGHHRPAPPSTAKDRGYNATIAAGASTEFGFIVAGSGAPTSCTINGAPAPAAAGHPTTAPTTKPPTTAPTTPPTAAPPRRPPTTGRRDHAAPTTTTAAAGRRRQRARRPVRGHGPALQRQHHARAAGRQRRA